MKAELKPNVNIANTFDLLDIRIGKILTVELAADTAKPSYEITADFGKYGIKRSVARLTKNSVNDLLDKQILGILNLGSRIVGGIESQFLCLGVQIPKAKSGEATIVSPLLDVKLGSKLF
jgi:tRNA-binding protein